MIDLTDYREMQEPIETRTIMTCTLRLDKETMINALRCDGIHINGEYFKVPERALLDCLIEKRYGETRLSLEKI